MAHARDAETLGLLVKAQPQQRCATVALHAQRLAVPYGPPLRVAIGAADDPRSRWHRRPGRRLAAWPGKR